MHQFANANLAFANANLRHPDPDTYKKYTLLPSYVSEASESKTLRVRLEGSLEKERYGGNGDYQKSPYSAEKPLRVMTACVCL